MVPQVWGEGAGIDGCGGLRVRSDAGNDACDELHLPFILHRVRRHVVQIGEQERLVKPNAVRHWGARGGLTDAGAGDALPHSGYEVLAEDRFGGAHLIGHGVAEPEPTGGVRGGLARWPLVALSSPVPASGPGQSPVVPRASTHGRGVARSRVPVHRKPTRSVQHRSGWCWAWPERRSGAGGTGG